MTIAVLAPPVLNGVANCERLQLHHGSEIRDAQVAYTLYGDVSLPAVVVLGGISAGRNVTTWWSDFVGPDRAIDTHDFAVLGIDFIGGSGESTGPTKKPFPKTSTFDQARAVAAALDDIGIATVRAFVGSSYGGMVALCFAALYPHRASELVVIGAAHEPHPMATALRSLQRRTIRLGIETGRVAEAVAIARGIAVTTYRTADEFAERFAPAARRSGEGFSFEVEDYLEHCGAAYARTYSPWGFLCLSESIDLHSIDPARITVPTTLVSVSSDTLVPSWQMRALAQRINAPARLVEIESRYGHDAFLKEVAAVSGILRRTLYEGGAP